MPRDYRDKFDLINEAHKYVVQIDKTYFPPGTQPEEYRSAATSVWEQLEIIANTRGEAAQKAWAMHGARWLSLMRPPEGRLPRKVSLHVSGLGFTMKAGRMAPITVYTAQPISKFKGDLGT